MFPQIDGLKEEWIYYLIVLESKALDGLKSRLPAGVWP